MNLKGMIIDLDGTLLDSMACWDTVGADFLRKQKIAPPNKLNEIIKEMSFEESAQYFIDQFDLSYSVSQVINEFNRIVDDSYRHTMKLKPYAKNVLKTMKEKGIKLCIATVTDHRLAELALTRLGVMQYFEFIITCSEVGYGKNEPHIYHKAAQLFNLKPAELGVVEDALYCIKTAKDSGFYVFGMYDESAKLDREAIMSTCDKYVTSFKELEESL